MKKIAHRGASGHALENSLDAFQKALDMNADMIELDIQTTKDGEFIVFHDYTLNRCTDHDGKVNKYTLEELNSEVKLTNCEKILSLSEFCEFISEQNIELLIELKNEDSATQVFKQVKKYLKVENFIIGSFYHEQILDLKMKFENARTCIMFECFPVFVEEFVQKARVDYVALGFESTNKDLVERIQNTGVRVYVWTVNEDADIQHAKEMKVDGIISNYIDRI